MKLSKIIKKNKIKIWIPLLVVLIGMGIASCSSNVGAASSWPGLTVGDNLAIVSYGYQLYALSSENGSTKWVFPEKQDSKKMFFAPVEFAGDAIIVGDYAHDLYALNSSDGTLKWQFNEAASRYVASAFYKDGFIYAPNADKRLYVLDQNGVLQWVFETKGANWSKPVADDQHLYLASMDHHIYALNLKYLASELTTDENGTRNLVTEPIWKTDLKTAIVSNPLLADGFLYVGTIGGNLFKINSLNGEIIWNYEGETKIKSIWTQPVVLDGAIFFATEDGYIHALDVTTGELLWDAPMATDSQIVASGVLINKTIGFGTLTGKLVLVDKDQKTLPSISREGAIYTTPLYKDGKLYLVTANGEKLVYALDENGREYWSFSTKQ